MSTAALLVSPERERSHEDVFNTKFNLHSQYRHRRNEQAAHSKEAYLRGRGRTKMFSTPSANLSSPSAFVCASLVSHYSVAAVRQRAFTWAPVNYFLAGLSSILNSRSSLCHAELLIRT